MKDKPAIHPMVHKMDDYATEQIHNTILHLIHLLKDRKHAAGQLKGFPTGPEYLQNCNDRILEILNIPKPQ